MRLILLLVLLLPAACAEMNPYTRAGMWQPTGTNARNLTAMLADPVDVVRGHGAAGADSPLAIAAAERLLAGHPTALPANGSASGIGAPTGGGAAQGGS